MQVEGDEFAAVASERHSTGVTTDYF